MIGWGTVVHVLLEVAQMAHEQMGVNCEVIDLQSIMPYDSATIEKVRERAVSPDLSLIIYTMAIERSGGKVVERKIEQYPIPLFGQNMLCVQSEHSVEN